jgi:predicted DNA-binding transcriptional regulator YafY
MASDGRLFWVRARWLLEQLRRGAPVTASTMAQALRLSVPTARRVIASLRDDFDAPMHYDDARQSWRLDDPHFDLPRLPLSAEEVAALALARALFERVSTPALAHAIESFWRKLESELFARSPAGSALARSVDAALPSISKISAATLETVLRALALRRQLHLVYRSPWSNERSERHVDPARLLLYDGTYYLIAHCRLRGELRSFNLAAVERVTLSERAAEEPDSRAVERYLAAGWGAFRGRGAVAAVVRIDPPVSRLLATQIWHEAQHDRFTPDGALVRRLPVSGLPELTRRVLSLGSSATVLEPPELAAAVAAEIRAMAARLEPARGARPGPGPRSRRSGRTTASGKKLGG